jgi:hypothetical protein
MSSNVAAAIIDGATALTNDKLCMKSSALLGGSSFMAPGSGFNLKTELPQAFPKRLIPGQPLRQYYISSRGPVTVKPKIGLVDAGKFDMDPVPLFDYVFNYIRENDGEFIRVLHLTACGAPMVMGSSGNLTGQSIQGSHLAPSQGLMVDLK